MLKRLPVILLSILFYFNGVLLIAQKAKLLTTSIEEIDNKLVIKYDIQKSRTSQQFIISVEITNHDGYPLPVKSLSGDIGENVAGGNNKQIVWDYNEDKIVMQQDINIRIVGYLKGEQLGLPKALLLSTLWPGYGMYRSDKSFPYWIIGLAGYGTLGASYYLNKKANENYTAYIANTLDEQNDVLLSKSQDQDLLSNTMAYAAAGIWGINLVWTAIKVKRQKKDGVSMQKDRNFNFYASYNPFTKTSGFTLKLNF